MALAQWVFDSSSADAPEPAVPAPPAARATTVDRGEAPEPVRVRIPAIGVDAPVVALGLQADGSIEVPTDFSETGWWEDGPEPGEPGPAVILGHVDSYDSPAVFYRLRQLVPGDQIHVDRADGTTVTYRVDGQGQYPKASFPTDAVYGPQPASVLRLVTCDGAFDRGLRSYEDNRIVFASASLPSAAEPPGAL